MWKKGQYSIVQFTADPARGELVNVGVILAIPEAGFLGSKIVNDDARVRRIFPGTDPHFFRNLIQSAASRLASEKEFLLAEENLATFIAKRANSLQLTPLRFIKVDDAPATLDRLFKELVEVPRRGRLKTEKVATALRGALKRAGVERLVNQPVTVDLPGFHNQLRAPFSYRNGRLNLIEPVRFNADDPDEMLTKASKHAIQGQILWRSPHEKFGDMKLVVVGKFESVDAERYSAIKATMHEHRVTLYRLDDVGPLVDDIRHAAEQHGLLQLLDHPSD